MQDLDLILALYWPVMVTAFLLFLTRLYLQTRYHLVSKALYITQIILNSSVAGLWGVLVHWVLNNSILP